MIKIDLPQLHCYRCGNVWTPRRAVVRICPRCKSVHWDEPKLRVPAFGGGLGIKELLLPHRRTIQRIAGKYGAREVRVFGSVARNRASPDSDVDFLVEFDPKKRSRSALRSIGLALELEGLLRRRVEVVTENSLHWLVQPQVIAEAVPL